MGNERFEGYCADLAKKIAERLNFDYILKVVDDGKLSSEENNNKRVILQIKKRIQTSDVKLVQKKTLICLCLINE